jgi:hypothetical protein
MGSTMISLRGLPTFVTAHSPFPLWFL